MEKTFGQQTAMLEKKEKSRNYLKRIRTIASEICGIVGLAFSIATFFYAQQISEKQSVIEKANRERQTNSIIDNGMITKILIMQESQGYKHSKYKEVLDNIIKLEKTFYLNFSINDYDKIGNNKHISKNDTKGANSFLENLTNFINNDLELGNALENVYKSFSTYGVLNDSIYSGKLKSNMNHVLKESTHINNLSKKLKKSIYDSNELRKQYNVDIVYVTNNIIKQIKEDDYINKKINYFRESIKFIDYIFNNIALNQNYIIIPDNKILN